MTLKLKLFACLAILSAALLALAGAFYHTAQDNEAAFSTILVDRVEPLEDLKTVADTYAVLIVDNAHKALNGNIRYAEAEKNVREGEAAIEKAWASYRATSIEGEEEVLAKQVEAQMATADAAVLRLEAILEARNSDALKRFVDNELYQTIDPVSESIAALTKMQIDIASDVTGQALILVIAIMSFLACIAVGAVSLVNKSAETWQSQIAREATIQIRPADDFDMNAALQKAEAIAEQFPGVRGARIIGREETVALLEPWLGSGLGLDELPEMGRGKGVRLQKYKDGGMSDATTFTLADGLSWRDPAGRTRTESNLAEWQGKRAGTGRMAPRGFPRDNTFT